jgi:hypothetical protein
MSLRGGVRCIFVYVYFPHLLGDFLHILTCTCNYMLWPLAPWEYNLSIPNSTIKKNNFSLLHNEANYADIGFIDLISHVRF